MSRIEVYFHFIKSIYMNAAQFRKETSLQSQHHYTHYSINKQLDLGIKCQE